MLYRDEILDHYHHPQNFGRLDEPTHKGEFSNTSCGDEILVELIIKDGKITKVGFTGRGCAISIAAASLITGKVKGKNITDISQLEFEDIVDLMGPINAGRQKCAMLPLVAIKQALS